MGRKTKNADTLGVHMPDAWHVIIQERANALGMTKSKFAREVFALWIEAGCPPINAADAALQTLKSGSAQQLPAKSTRRPAA